MRSAGAAYDPARPETVLETTLHLLWYSVFATNDAREKLGGNPYDNRSTRYQGSSDDARLNAEVERFSASATALANLAPYQTSGALVRPLITLHTTGDEVVPFWHEILYLGKTWSTAQSSFIPIPVPTYGHCNFSAIDVLVAFAVLVDRVQRGSAPGAAARPLPALEPAARMLPQTSRDLVHDQHVAVRTP